MLYSIFYIDSWKALHLLFLSNHFLANQHKQSIMPPQYIQKVLKTSEVRFEHYMYLKKIHNCTKHKHYIIFITHSLNSSESTLDIHMFIIFNISPTNRNAYIWHHYCNEHFTTITCNNMNNKYATREGYAYNYSGEKFVLTLCKVQ